MGKDILICLIPMIFVFIFEIIYLIYEYFKEKKLNKYKDETLRDYYRYISKNFFTYNQEKRMIKSYIRSKRKILDEKSLNDKIFNFTIKNL